MTRIFMPEYFGGRRYGGWVFVWDKLYRREFLVETGIQFDPKIRAGLSNDGLFNFMLAGKAKKIVGTTYMGYHYRCREESGGRSFGPDRPEAVHYILERLNEYAAEQNQPEIVWKALDGHALINIKTALENCFFHPENKDGYRKVARGIRKMKSMKYYKRAIYSDNNPFLSSKQKTLQVLLRQPLIFPLKIACGLRSLVDK